MVKMDDIIKIEKELIENYKHLHQYPEISFEEYKTSIFILKKLAEYGIEGKQIALTGIVATIKGGKPGKTIAIRADMDALPITEETTLDFKSQTEGVMHACGHDAHVAILLGTAKYFSEHKNNLRGNVRLIFQPAEEDWSIENVKKVVANGGSELGGAASMIKLGALTGVDACFALHVFPDIPTGSLKVHSEKCFASSDTFELIILGKGGHGSSPETAIDPVGALSGILAAFNQFPAREISPLDECVVSVGTINTDSSWNIIPDKVKVTGCVRTFNKDIRKYTLARLSEIAQGICTAHRCFCQFESIPGVGPTINHPIISNQMVDVANKVFGEGKGILVERPLMASEDVGYYFEKVPGAIGMLGSMVPNEEYIAPHNPNYKINLNSLRYGVLFNVNMVIHYLNNN